MNGRNVVKVIINGHAISDEILGSARLFTERKVGPPRLAIRLWEKHTWRSAGRSARLSKWADLLMDLCANLQSCEVTLKQSAWEQALTMRVDFVEYDGSPYDSLSIELSQVRDA